MKKNLDSLLENFINKVMLMEASKAKMIETFANNISKTENLPIEKISLIIQKANPLQQSDQDKETYDLYLLMEWNKDLKGAKQLDFHKDGVPNENFLLNVRKHLEFFKLYVKPSALREKGMRENLNKIDLWKLKDLIETIDSKFGEEYKSFISGVAVKEEEDDQPDCVLKKADGFEFQTRQGPYEAYRIMNIQTLRKVGKATCWCVGVYEHFAADYYNRGSSPGHNFILIVDSTSFEPKRKENSQPTWDSHYEPYKKITRFPKKICSFDPHLTSGLSVDPFNRNVISIMSRQASSKLSNCVMSKSNHKKDPTNPQSEYRCAEELGLPVMSKFPDEVYYIMLKMSLPKPEGAGNSKFSWGNYPLVFWQSMPSKVLNEIIIKGLMPSYSKCPNFYAGIYHNTGLFSTSIEKLIELDEKKELPKCQDCNESFKDHFSKNIAFKLHSLNDTIKKTNLSDNKKINELKKIIEKNLELKKTNVILNCLSLKVDPEILGKILRFVYENIEDFQDSIMEKIQLLMHELKTKAFNFENENENENEDFKKAKQDSVDKGDFFKMICQLPELAKTFISDDPEFFVNLAIPTEIYSYEKETVAFEKDKEDKKDKEEGVYFIPKEVHVDIDNNALNEFLKLAQQIPGLKIPTSKIIYVFQNIEKFSISKETQELLLNFLKDEELVKYDSRAFDKMIFKIKDDIKEILLTRYRQAIRKSQSGTSGPISKRKLEF